MTSTSPNTSRPWWDRALDPIVDVVEERIIDPLDEVITPRIERYQAGTEHRLVSAARRVLERRAVGCWPSAHAHRARLLHAWAGLEDTAAHTRAGLHTHHTGRPDGSTGCCAALIQLYSDRAEVIRALAVTEEQTARRMPGRAPVLDAMPKRLRNLAADQFTELVNTPYSTRDRAEIARNLVEVLEPHLGAAVAPIRGVYVG